MSRQFDKFMADVAKNNFELFYVQVRRDGEIIDDWARFPSKPRFESYSSSKSFAAVGVGIAIDEGLISLDERVADSFKDKTYDIENPYALDITVRDMLTMSTGLKKAMFFRESYERAHSHDWIRDIYKNGEYVNKPGEKFLYCNINPYMLGCLIERKTGQNLHEYLRYRLFEPLCIHNPDWTICPQGHTVAANGMGINVDELGRFGQMLANGGVYNGKRLVSESYVHDMLSYHIDSNEFVPGHPDTQMGYGYQIWVDPINKCAYPWGIFGQYCIIMPEKNTIITIQGLEASDGGSNGAYCISPLRNLIWEDLVTQY